MNESGAQLYDSKGNIVTQIQNDSSFDANIPMLNDIAEKIISGAQPESHVDQVKMIQEAYANSGSNEEMVRQTRLGLSSSTSHAAIKAATNEFVWPLITYETENAVIKQLHTAVSLYNKAGIFEKFENEYAQYHGKKHALLSNSGTSAIFSMFEGLNLLPGDEVICPAYTFFATVSPLIHTGAKPVFVDCKEDGNIDPEKIEEKITDKTKAMIVTHMWGVPCDMDKITEICDKYNVPLLEDCSHAHGATFNNKLCGTFGKAAAWSLQGQKTITGGEGGIMLTDDAELFYRALAQGHYNKRCKDEIPKDHPLHKFALTGMGMKFRAHPLAIAMADQQFQHLGEWVNQRAMYAQEFTDVLSNYDFVTPPNTHNRNPSWYAYVFQVNEGKVGNPSAKQVFDAMQAQGLKEADMPGSTAPIYNLPLFTMTHEIMPRLYKEPAVTNEGSFSVAEQFYRQAVKLPVWCRPEDRAIVDKYKDGLNKALKSVQPR